MNSRIPRVVVITRETEYDMLIARHATRGQAAFFLKSRGQSLEVVEARHQRLTHTLAEVMTSIPKDWRRNHVRRDELDRFGFEPDDLIIIVGQDGLVANVAKYLNGQRVIGINPDTEFYDGVLVPFSSQAAIELILPAMFEDVSVQLRTMAQATLDDGQTLLALNELFVGHRSHQSARYRIHADNKEERHSSSGVIVTTGTGATGWARSIHQERHDKLVLPKPEDDKLAFYVREAFPSVSTGTDVTAGLISKHHSLTLRSENNEGGVIFGDGIESDYLEFNWGVRADFSVANTKLRLVIPG